MKKTTLKTKLPKHLLTVPKISYCTYRKYRPTFFQPDTLLEKCTRVVDVKSHPIYWEWTVEDVAEWIADDLGHPEFKETFLENNIDGKSLVLLEADKFPRINIKQFHIIKELTANIRKLHNIHQEVYEKSISLPPRDPKTLYLRYKATNVGPISYFTTLSKYCRRMNIIRDEVSDAWKFYTLLNHWNRIPPYMPWCPHVDIGGIPRVNPMTGTRQRQITEPKSSPYVLKDLNLYKLPRRKSSGRGSKKINKRKVSIFVKD